MGSSGWEAGEKREREGCRIPSAVHLNPSCVSPPGPPWSGTTGGEMEGPQRREGEREREREGGESVEGENEQALLLFPGDLWS